MLTMCITINAHALLYFRLHACNSLAQIGKLLDLSGVEAMSSEQAISFAVTHFPSIA